MPSPAAELARTFGSLVSEEAAVLTASLLLLSALVGAAELLHRRLGWPVRATRRLVHAAAGLYVVAMPHLFGSAAPVYLLAATFVVVNGQTAARGWLRGINPERQKNWGTVAFPLALLTILPFSWGEERAYILQTAFLVLAIADPLAATVGERYGRRRARIGTATKSLAGSLTFFLLAWLLALGGLAVFGPAASGDSLGRAVVAAGLTALVATAVEALGGRGWDNFFIVVAIAAVLILWQTHPARLPVMGVGGAVGVLFALFAWRMEYLTPSGAIAGGLFAATLVGAGGWGWMVPGFTFFILSSAISRWAPEAKGAYAETAARESRRDETQVYANGGVAWLLVIAYAMEPHVWIYWGFVGSLAAATADTWATEIGPVFRQQPRMILSGRRVPKGTSGAITAAGTLAGALGAVVIWTSAWWTASGPIAAVGAGVSLVAVVGGGMLGSLVDSLAGATVQAVYREPRTGGTIDGGAGAGAGLERVGGWRAVDNDVVNALCTAAGAAAAVLAVIAL